MSGKSQARAELDALRQQIDAVDHELLRQLARRMALVAEIASVKRLAQVPIRDRSRERRLLEDRCARARELGLPETGIESVFRLLMMASRDRQAVLGAELPQDSETRSVLVVGGAGAMGRLFVRMFSELGHRVSATDVDSKARARELAAQVDVVLVSVPIDVTTAVIRELGPRVRKDALLMDVASIKSEPVAAMLEHCPGAVLGTHPMFGPSVNTVQGQRVVLCPGRGTEWQRWVEQMFRARGMVVTETSAEEHDRAMAAVQVLTHYQTQVQGLALSRLGIEPERTRALTSPVYLMELYMTARHFAQSPELYGPIEMRNPLSGTVTRTFVQAAEELAKVLSERDVTRFRQMFEDVRTFFGDFSEEAVEQSGFLIDRLVERS